MPPRVSVVIPCYNERATIAEIVRLALAQPLVTEVVAVDDCSGDGTREELARLEKAHARLRVVLHERNRGKGAALRTGFARAAGDVVIVQDADLEYDPGEFPRLLEPFVERGADVVYGSRFVGGASHRVLYYWHYLGNRMLTTLSNVFTNLNLTDMEVCYKAFRRSVLERITLEEDRFGFEPEVTAKIAKLGCCVYEVGVSYAGRTYADGKKIGWRDGLWAVWCILKYNLLR